MVNINIDSIIFILFIILPILAFIFYFLFKDKYLILKLNKEINFIQTKFWKEIEDYRVNKKIKFKKLVDYINYLLYLKISKKLNYEILPSRIMYNEIKEKLGDDYLKELKKLLKMINKFKKRSFLIVNYEKFFYKILVKYQKLTGDVIERS